jgi:uncharacterized protein
VFRNIRWVPIDNPDPGEGDTLREMYDATHISKAEGTWTGQDGSIWFVSSRGDGPDVDDPDDWSVNRHGGQVWVYDPRHNTLELVVQFETGHQFQAPDNITQSPYGYMVLCTDNSTPDQYLAGLTRAGDVFPLAYNRVSDEEFAGACFSPDRRTLFANIMGSGFTFAIWGPWNG